MRKSKTLAKLRIGQPVRLCSFGHFIPAYVGHAAKFGFDCIWLDLEHRTMTDREVQALLAFCHRFDIDCMVRSPSLEKTRLYRYLEDGATGLMIPHVSSPEKAQMLVDAVKFPPHGDRGFDGAGLDIEFYPGGRDAYIDMANQETFLAVQIETPQAVESIDEIAAVDGVDVLFIGPADLELRIQRTETTLTLEEAIRRVASAADRHGKAWGCPGPTLERVRELHAQGARLIAYGADFSAVLKMLQCNAADLDTIYGVRGPT